MLSSLHLQYNVKLPPLIPTMGKLASGRWKYSFKNIYDIMSVWKDFWVTLMSCYF